MASNFFERQDRARNRTWWLVLLFLLALVGIAATTSGLAYYAFVLAEQLLQSSATELPTSQTFMMGSPWPVVVCVGLVTLAIILFGSLYKVISLRSGGGCWVAESLGGTRILPSTEDPNEKRVLNVVEEMALASGTPVPPVFHLRGEEAINAFAAGYSPSDAVIGVTRGAVERLTRDQLQGVIAHEFSHIFNGDMRLGIRLIGILHGILLLNLMGRFLFQMFVHDSSVLTRRSRDSKDSGIVLIAVLVSVALIAIGIIGSFIGSLIKAAVSRQREYLADASAVQFTRNPLGLSGALKTIAALSGGSIMKAPNAAEASHLFFAQGIRGGFASWLSTHPPLSQRILALEPSWDGTLPELDDAPTRTVSYRNNDRLNPAAAVASLEGQGSVPERSPSRQAYSTSHLSSSTIQDAVAHVGLPEIRHREYAQSLLQQIPPTIRKLLDEPYGARAVIFALLADRDKSIAKAQVRALVDHGIENHVIELTVKLLPTVHELPAKLRLPIIDLSIPSLKAMSGNQYAQFEKAVSAFMKADGKLTIFEWGLGRILIRHLRSQFHAVQSPRVDYFGLQRLGNPVSILLSAVARAGHEEQSAGSAFDAARPFLPRVPLTLQPPEACRIRALEEAVEILRTTSFRSRGQLMDAAAAIICSDQVIHPSEAELLRGIADMLESPMPPFLPGQQLY